MSLISHDNSWKVLWTLYAGGLLWVRNSAQKVLLDLWVLWEKKLPSVKEMLTHTSCQQANRGNLTYYAPPCGGGDGGGATLLWTRNAGGKILLNLWVLWEKEIPSVREKDFLCDRERYSLWEKEISSVRKKHYPPCEKELPKKSWCKEIKKPKAYLKTKLPLPQFMNMLFSMREHAL